jgi:hypothetical protein
LLRVKLLGGCCFVQQSPGICAALHTSLGDEILEVRQVCHVPRHVRCQD